MPETFKQFAFEAAHQTQPYSGVHGHSFTVGLYNMGRSEAQFGWSHNLDEVKSTLDRIKKRVDHKYLNNIAGL
jgi:6-pyruvoyltetrahydropterin/6-carboxytetrahydropterin synthase